MVCPSCNRINSGKWCSVHGVMTCLGCLYDYPGSKCDVESFVKQSEAFVAKSDAEYEKLLGMIKTANDMWTTQ